LSRGLGDVYKRQDVYYEKYREARQKAKIARDLALSSYLEAKRIKNTYMLDEIEDSDEDFYEEDDDEESEEDTDEDPAPDAETHVSASIKDV
jgi:hypothetical protein